MRLGYFSCDVMLGTRKLMHLDVREEFIEFEVFDEKQLHYIWEFEHEITAEGIHEWLLSRLPDDDRHNLLSECNRYGIKPIGADIFKISKGKQLYDDYWLDMLDIKKSIEEEGILLYDAQSVQHIAYLSNENTYTVFKYKDEILKIAGPKCLIRYESIVSWEDGLLTVMARYGEKLEEEYIDVFAALKGLFIDTDKYKEISSVVLEGVCIAQSGL